MTHVHCGMYVIIFILYKNSDPESQQKSAVGAPEGALYACGLSGAAQRGFWWTESNFLMLLFCR